MICRFILLAASAALAAVAVANPATEVATAHLGMSGIVPAPPGAATPLTPPSKAARRASPVPAVAQALDDRTVLSRLHASGYTVTPAQVVWYTSKVAPPNRVTPSKVHYVNNPLTVYGGIAIPVGRSGFSAILR